MKLKNNTILITGGSAGIGLEFAKQLSELGNQVIITGRDIKKLELIIKEFPRIYVIKSDVTQIEDIKALHALVTKDFPTLNLLINNAGIGQKINFQEKQDVGIISREIDTNLLAPIRMINEFLPNLMSQSESAIVNVTSAVAFVPAPIIPLYSASKAGLHSFTLSLRAQLRDTRVKVFEITPPTTNTDMLKGFGKSDLKGVSVMSTVDMVAYSLRGLVADRFEICPGQAKQMKLMSRIAPGFMLSQMSRSLERRLPRQ